MDLFTDLFTPTELLGALRRQQYIPSQLAQLFGEPRGLYGTTFAWDEDKHEAVDVLTETPRGTPSGVNTLVKDKTHTFVTKHFRRDASVFADEVLGSRAIGSVNRQLIQERRDRQLAKLRQQLDITLESLRVTCLNTPTNTLGSAPSSVAVAFGASDSSIRSSIHNNIIKVMESALDGTGYTGIVAYCQDTFWQGLIESKTVKETYLNWQAAAELRGSTLDQFAFGGVTWVRYRGTSSVDITSGKAKVVPVGVPDLFVQAYAPADTMDQIGSGVRGGPYYVKGYPIDQGDRGWYMEAQTNPVMVCTRPEAVLTIGLS